ncbi:MAG TPA: NADP-dependent phosphogluconate dehydrogenase [Solirubrobacteraceae bacterium]|jgi:6-phosphogluconate dehydrogenase|nr:NADP-dependent phosphogluconate dehydrogenase [Solirubrobacteraceae bacterium]
MSDTRNTQSTRDSDRGRATIGVTGLATMGRNLARNLARNGYTVALHNRTQAKVDALVSEFGHEGDFVPSASLEEFVDSLEQPRAIIILVKAGAPTDAVIDELVPLLEEGDIVVDAGNAHFADTARREKALRERGLNFVGSGVSGGEEGALHGPSIMPGGSEASYEKLGPIFERISAHVDGVPCCMHVGPGAAGHFVKMVHNGIEYADMQLIAEAYDLMREIAGASPEQLAGIFGEWNKGDLESFLIELTMQVLAHTDAETGKPFVDIVEDQAEQKGTGRWTVQSALDLGVPVTGIAEATFARSLSGHAEQRSIARHTFGGEVNPQQVDAAEFIEDVRKALYASKIVAYAQGFDQIRTASDENDWAIDLGRVATIWRGGCIIRARFLNRIREAYDDQAELPTLLAAPFFADVVKENLGSWRRVTATAAASGVPAPAFASSLAYFDALRRKHLPASLIQGLRDNFGAHTYRRTDREGSFHTLWAEAIQEEVAVAEG